MNRFPAYQRLDPAEVSLVPIYKVGPVGFEPTTKGL